MVTCQSANQLKTPAKVSWAFKTVSQFGSLGYTIMGKTADLTVVQKTIIDTLHKESKPQTFIAKEAGCSQSAVSKHVNRKLSGRKKCGRKRCTTKQENADFIFQQDLVPAHTAKSTKSLVKWPWCWCAWLASKLTRPEPQRIYGVLSRGKWETRDQKNADELKATVKEICVSVPPQQCQKLITSMPRRIEAVIKAKGAPTKHWVHIQ